MVTDDVMYTNTGKWFDRKNLCSVVSMETVVVFLHGDYISSPDGVFIILTFDVKKKKSSINLNTFIFSDTQTRINKYLQKLEGNSVSSEKFISQIDKTC